jgi:hypothetical protein
MANHSNLLRQFPTSAFQTSEEAFKESSFLKSKLGVQSNAKIARLAIGRSLGEQGIPDLEVNSRGNVIKGNNLFPLDDVPLWIGYIYSHATAYGYPQELNIKSLQSLVRGHWHRGISLLLDDWSIATGDYRKFIELLATRRAKLPPTVAKKTSSSPAEEHQTLSFDDNPQPIELALGEVAGEQVCWRINGVGYSPHIAIMGQAGAGKTRILLHALSQIKEQADCSTILLDLGKGDLANDVELAQKLSATVIQVPEQPIPLDLFYGSSTSETKAGEILISFRDSLSKVTSSFGAVQKERMREALRPMFSKKDQISLRDIGSTLTSYYNAQSLKPDTVISTINDLTERELFRPQLSPREFFSRSWIITFGNAHDTYKMLCAYLLLDALNFYAKASPEAKVDNYGNRTIRTALAIDEARAILSAKHDALSTIIRLHRAKGLVALLSSQSPDDYDGTSDDYLENIGLPICLRTNARSTKVLSNMFNASPNLSSLQTGEFFTIIDGSIKKLKAF